jgi:hypothetical protein
VRALDVEWEELERWRVAVTGDEATWASGWEKLAKGNSAMQGQGADSDHDVEGARAGGDVQAEKAIWRRVGVARGWLE